MSPRTPLTTRKVTLPFLLALLWLPAVASAQNGQPLLKEEATKVSDHVYVIMGFPNIGIVVGNRATLVVDTGLGAKNGATVVSEAKKLAKAPNLFLTTTHFHPEHATGEQAFPSNTVLIRPVVQQQEMDKRGPEFIELFRNMSPQNKDLLQDVKLRTPDILFGDQVKVDLGGVTALLFWLGPAHTKGDELIFVEEDSVLLPGDIVQNKLFPNMPNSDASVAGWIAILDKIAPLQPRFIVPDHGTLGDGSLIAQERGFLVDLQTQALALKQAGVSVEDAGKMLTATLKAKYPDWIGGGATIANAVRRVYEEAH